MLGTQPACESATCLTPITPDNGWYEPYKTIYNFTKNVRISCLLGFDSFGPNTSYVKLLVIGRKVLQFVKSRMVVTCNYVRLLLVCENITDINNGRFNIAPGYSGLLSYGAVAEFNFISEFIVPGCIALQCEQNEKWNDTYPICIKQECIYHTQLINGSIEIHKE